MNSRKDSFKYGKSQLISRANVLESLSSDSPATIKQLSARTRLSTPTVTKALSQLEELDLVSSKGHRDQPKGRKPALYGTSEEHYWLGIDLEIPDLRIAVYDLSKRLIKSKKDFIYLEEETDNVDTEFPRNLIQKIKEFLDQQEISLDSILGVGAGVPGMVSQGKFRPFSRLKNPPVIPIKEPLETELGLPVVVGNDVDLELLAELDRRNLLDEPGVVAVYLAARPSNSTKDPIKIGGSVFHRGSTLQGATGTASEFGHTSISGSDFRQAECDCGNPRCLETYVNRKVKESSDTDPTSEIVEVLIDKLRDLVFLYNPSLLILDLLAFPRIVKPILEELNEFVSLRENQLNVEGPEIVTPGDSEMACARGACIKSIRDLSENPVKYPDISLD